MHYNSLDLWRRHGLPHVEPGIVVLEVGPDHWETGREVHDDVVSRGVKSYWFYDERGRPDMPEAYLWGPENHPPADVVVALNVLEHAEDPFCFFKSVKLHLKPGGVFVCGSPISWPQHRAPLDCWRILPDGYRHLLKVTEFELLGIHEQIMPRIEAKWLHEHGPGPVSDVIAIGRRPR